jgi:hypothetical protein
VGGWAALLLNPHPVGPAPPVPAGPACGREGECRHRLDGSMLYGFITYIGLWATVTHGTHGAPRRDRGRTGRGGKGPPSCEGAAVTPNQKEPAVTPNDAATPRLR